MKKKYKLLYVEDNRSDVDQLQHHFTSNATEFDITIAETGEACISALKKEHYDILLSDHKLPDMDGIDILRTIRKLELSIPVVMITGRGDEELVVQALRAGVSDYITKTGNYLIPLPTILNKVICEYEKGLLLNLPNQTGAKHILYVEHITTDIDLVQRALSENSPNFILHVADRCEEALQLLREKSFELAIVDLRMPDMSGLEFLKQLRYDNISIPVIITTGRGDEATAIAALKLGASDYVVKRGDYLNHLPFAIENAIVRFQLDQMNEKLHVELETWNRSLEKKVKERTAELEKEIVEHKQAEDKIKSQLEELQSWYNVTLGREGRVVELKQEVNDLLKQLGKEIKYHPNI